MSDEIKLDSFTKEKRINNVQLAIAVASLATEMKSYNKRINNVESMVSQNHDLTNKINNKLFVDNGKTSIITMFKENDVILAEHQVETDKKLNNLCLDVKILSDQKTRKEKFKKWIIPIIISVLISIFTILISLNVIQKKEYKTIKNKTENQQQIILTGNNK